jgi:fumarate hydratase class II
MNLTVTDQVRIEEDALGNVEVPSEHLWGAQTQRSHMNFPIGVERFRWGRPVIRALGILKKCAALANGDLGQLSKENGRLKETNPPQRRCESQSILE